MLRLGRYVIGFRHILICLLAAWLIFNLIQTISYVVADYSPIPLEDYWRIPQLWANHQTVRWSNLWEQHNEHRIVFPELIFIVDMFFLHGRMYLPIAMNGACCLGMWLLLVLACFSQESLRSPVREIALLLTGVVLFWKGSSTLIATPFQLAFPLLEVSSLVSFFFLAKLSETSRVKHLTIVIAAGVVATYTVANGMLLWIALIAWAIFLQMKIRQIAILSAAALLFSAVYFNGYRFLPNSIGVNVKHPVRALAFLCSYFEMPFGSTATPMVGIQIGAANLLLMAVCAAFAWRQNLMRSRIAVVVFGSYLFLLLSAILTALGRMDLNDHLFAQAKAWRYITMPTLSWALAAFAVIWLTGTLASRRTSLAVALATSCLIGIGFNQSDGWVETTRFVTQNGQIGATMMRNGVFDPGVAHIVFPDPDFVRMLSRFFIALEQNRKSVYAHGRDKWIGGNLLSLPLIRTPVQGKVTRILPVQGGVQIFGWAETNSLTDDHEILFVNDGKEIVGFGSRPAAGLPPNFSTPDTPNGLAFVGFVSLTQPHDDLSVYVRTFHGKAVQPLDQKIDLPAAPEKSL